MLASPITSLPTTTIPAKYSNFQNLGLGLNVMLVLIWLGAAFLYSFIVARRRGPILLLATYAGLSVAAVVSMLNVAALPTFQQLQKGDLFSFSVFLITSVLAFVALARTIRSRTRIPTAKAGILIMGALEMGAFLAAAGSLLPTELRRQITGFSELLFTTPWVLALWLFVPLVVFLVGEYRERRILRD